jgi:hypothetical protein
VYDIVAVEIVDSSKDLLDCLRGVLLGELALLANAVEQLAAGGQLGDDVVLVPRFKPVHELDNVRVLEALEHVKLVPYHPLVTFYILLENNLDGDLAHRAVGLAHDAIGAGAKRASESVLGFLIVAIWLALEATEHSGDWRHEGHEYQHKRLIEGSRRESGIASAPHWMHEMGGKGEMM